MLLSLYHKKKMMHDKLTLSSLTMILNYLHILFKSVVGRYKTDFTVFFVSSLVRDTFDCVVYVAITNTCL
jgi:hypothetical protein